MFVRELGPRDDGNWDHVTDVLVIGGGGSGLTTATRASEAGVDVTVVEKATRVGGKTRLSTGQICGVGTRFQAEHDVEDSAAALVDDLVAVARAADVEEYIDPEHVGAVAARSAETLHWFRDRLGVAFHLHTGPYTQAAHRVPRTHYPRDDDGRVPRTGEPLVNALRAEATANGVTFHTETPIQQLVLSDGDVMGAISKSDPQPDPRRQVRTTYRADAVVIATDGYNANVDMRLADFPETAGLEHWGVQGNTGESVRWGDSLGAALEPRHYSAYAFFTEPDGDWLSAELVKEGGFFVNTDGRRYMDVGAEPYRMISKKTLDQPGSIGVVVIDQRIVDTLLTATLTEHQFGQTFANGAFVRGSTVLELSEELGIDHDALAASLTAVNRGAAGDEPGDGFGRAVGVSLSPPFYATEIKPQFIRARAGLRITDRAQVERLDGSTIPDLYAVGNAAESLEGGRAETYVAGLDLMNTLVTGYIAGETLPGAVS
jgi:fumarate reductase flavoprotein subunit